ncbi:SHOCT domain-containing protein [Alicyclobacillus curvatus]|nr:SHOCT domain-containing protein [Alicyclobacillus curvatus]
MMGFGGFGYGGGYGMGILGWVFQILILIGVVYLVVYLVRSMTHRDNSDHSSRTAKEIAAERYARGEITEEEYRKIRDSL